MRRVTFLLLVATALVSCGPSLDDITSEHGADGRANLAKLSAVLDHCRSLPPLETDELPDQVTGVIFADRLDRPVGNARTIWMDAHDDPGKWMDPINWSYLERDRWWRQPSRALREKPPEFEQRDLEALPADFADLDSTEYVLVIKTVEYTAPSHEAGTIQFGLGMMTGELHLYRMGNGKHLGGMSFTAYGEPIGFGGFDITLDSENPERSLRDLTDRLYGSIHDFAQARLAAALPGVDSIFTWEEGGAFQADRVKRKR